MLASGSRTRRAAAAAATAAAAGDRRCVGRQDRPQYRPNDQRRRCRLANVAGGSRRARTLVKKSDRPDAIKEFVGAMVRSPWSAGEPIRDSKVVTAKGGGFMAAVLPKGMRAVAIECRRKPAPAASSCRTITSISCSPAETRRRRRSSGVEKYISETILRNVQVLAVDQTVEDKDGQKVVGRQDRHHRARSAAGRNAGAFAAARHAVLDAAQPARFPVGEAGRRRPPKENAIAGHQHGALRREHPIGTHHDARRELKMRPGTPIRAAALAGSALAARCPAWPNGGAPATAIDGDPQTIACCGQRFRVALGRARHRQVGGHRFSPRHQGRAGRRSKDRQCGDPLVAPRLHDRQRRSARPTSSSSTPKASRWPASTSRSRATSTASARPSSRCCRILTSALKASVTA